jgi:Fe-S-cluster-containing dehydrogenase component
MGAEDAMSQVTAKPEVTKRVVLDLDLCIECRSCAAACYYGHNETVGVHFAEIGPALLPVVCRQCEEPACIDVCPSKSMHRGPSGIVERAVFSCRGCGSCARSCPFGVISLELSGHQVVKCDLCRDRTERGQEPRCVHVCPTGALKFVEESESDLGEHMLLGGRVTGRQLLKRR